MSLSDSPTKLTQTDMVSSRFPRAYLDPPGLTWIHSDSRCPTSIPSVSLRFTQLKSDSHQIRISADRLRFNHYRVDSPELTQMSRLAWLHTRFRSSHMFSRSLILVQIHSGSPRFIQISSGWLPGLLARWLTDCPLARAVLIGSAA